MGALAPLVALALEFAEHQFDHIRLTKKVTRPEQIQGSRGVDSTSGWEE